MEDIHFKQCSTKITLYNLVKSPEKMIFFVIMFVIIVYSYFSKFYLDGEIL